MVKRIVAIILTISIMCTLSAGCQSDDKATDSNKEDTAEKLEYKPDPVTLVVYTTFMSRDYLAKVRELEGIIRDTLNIHFDIRFVPGLGDEIHERREAVIKFLQSGTEFDLLYAEARWRYPYIDRTCNNSELIDLGRFMDLTDLLPQYAPKYYSRFSQEDLQAISYNGRIYNIPELTFESQRPCVFAWRSMIEKYDIKDIRTFEDFENYMELVKEKEKDYYPFYGLHFFPDIQMFVEPYGYVMLFGNIVYRRDDPEMKLVPWEQTDAFREAIKTIGRWREKKYDWGKSIEYNKSEFSKKYTSRLDHGVPEIIPKSWDKELEIPNDEWIMFQLYPYGIISRVIPARRIFISKNSKKAEIILKLIEWIHESQENFDKGSVKEYHSWNVIGPSNFYYERYDENKVYYLFDKEGYVDAVTRNSSYPPHSGYNPPARLIEKITERCSDFDTFFQEYSFKHITNSESAVKEFIQMQKDKGVDNLVKELQEDLDAWRLSQSG